MAHVRVLVFALVLASGACTTIRPWVCHDEALRATLATARLTGEDAVNDTLAGNYEKSEGNAATFEGLEGAFAGRSTGGSVAFYLQRGLDVPFNLNVWMRTPIQTGDVFAPPDGIQARGFRPQWDALPPSTGEPPLVIGFEHGTGFAASTVRGSARVLGVAPFRLALDLVLTDGAREVPIRGTLTVRHESSVGTCFE